MIPFGLQSVHWLRSYNQLKYYIKNPRMIFFFIFETRQVYKKRYNIFICEAILNLNPILESSWNSLSVLVLIDIQSTYINTKNAITSLFGKRFQNWTPYWNPHEIFYPFWSLLTPFEFFVLTWRIVTLQQNVKSNILKY